MKTEFCCSDKLVQYILRKIECEPDYIFREIELAKVSPKVFDWLRQNKFFIWQQFDYDHDLFFSSIPGDQSNPRHLTRRSAGKYWADPEETGLDRIVVEEKDIPHYRFDISKLIEQVVNKNGLEEPVNSVAERLWFVGSKDISGDRIGVFIAFNGSADDLGRELKGLPNSAGKYTRYIVLSPFSRIACQKTLNILNRISVSHLVFSDAFDGGFTFKAGIAFNETKEGLPPSLHVMGKIENEKYVIKIGGQEDGLTERNFMLLLSLVLGLKRDKEGWVYTPKMKDEGVITDSDRAWQAIGRLKDDLKRSFSGYDFDKFIQNGIKRYRLVIPADSVTYDKAMLKKIDNAIIAGIVKRLPVLRKGISK